MQAVGIGYLLSWVLAVAAILLLGRGHDGPRAFRATMLAQWKPSLAVTAVFELGMGLGRGRLLNPFVLALFCQALIGFALAGRVGRRDPLPIVRAVRRRDHPWRAAGLLLPCSLLLVVPVLFADVLGSVLGHLAGESVTNQVPDALRAHRGSAFFLLLAGAGIAEETPFRLALLSLGWRLTGRRWHHPITQLAGTALAGLVFGVAFVRRGYETAVLSHTLSDWIGVLLVS